MIVRTIRRFITALLVFSVSGVSIADSFLIEGPEAVLTESEMQMVMKSIPGDARERFAGNPKELRHAMDTTYMAEVLAARAVREGLEKDPEVQAKLWHHRINTLAGAYAESRKAAALEGADFGKAAEEYYKTHQDEFGYSKSVVVSHILLDKEFGVEAATDLRKRILHGDISFEGAVKEYSVDEGSKRRAGSLGEIEKGRTVPEFEQVVFDELKGEGDLSEPFESKFGIHIARIDRVIPAGVHSFDKVKAKIIEKLRATESNKIQEEMLLEIRDDPAAKAHEENIRDFTKSLSSEHPAKQHKSSL